MNNNTIGDISYENRFSNDLVAESFKNIWIEDLRNIYTLINTAEQNKNLNLITKIAKGKEKGKKIKFHARKYNGNVEQIEELSSFIEQKCGERHLQQLILKNIILGIFEYSKYVGIDDDLRSIEKIEILLNEIEKINIKPSDGSYRNFLRLKSFIKDYRQFDKIDKSLETLFENGVEFEDSDMGNFNFTINTNKIEGFEKNGVWDTLMILVRKRYLTIETGFSDGEWAILKLFANLFIEINSNEKINNFLIILDEGDMGFHPEWQRRYLDLVIKFFNESFSEKVFNLIIASHSPFIASDLPKENVIFMGVDDNPNLKTFGANIHELYKDSFFMKSTMGEFALSKIKGVIEDLTTLECIQRANRKLKKLEEKGEKLTEIDKQEKDKLEESTGERVRKKSEIEEKKETIKYVIDQIGERVLSRKLGEKYREIFGEEEKIEDKMKNLYSNLSVQEREILKNLGDQ